LRESWIAVDFRRIVRGDECECLRLDLTAFEEVSEIGEASRLYRGVKDGVEMEIVVEAFDVSQFDS
jgi:hypothetical protein